MDETLSIAIRIYAYWGKEISCEVTESTTSTLSMVIDSTTNRITRVVDLTTSTKAFHLIY
ncbi:hypothetical protein [Thorsellia kenyensis]|uniref:Uncharacterized protein n=1 Tax=Thorsellia kenyensis TaxID=1549888 RepID=A0ABV6C8V9_9GAMM